MKDNELPVPRIDHATTKKRPNATKRDFFAWARKVNADRGDSSQPSFTTGGDGMTPHSTSLAESLAGLEPPPLPCRTERQILQRLAVDIPADLHAMIKEMASRPGASVREDITALLAWFYKMQ